MLESGSLRYECSTARLPRHVVSLFARAPAAGESTYMTRPRHKKRSAGKRERAVAPSPVWASQGSPVVRWLCLAIVVAAGTVSFANSFEGAFIYDDSKWVVRNAPERNKAIWKSSFEATRPLVELTLAANYRLNAKYNTQVYEAKSSDIEPWGYHLVNLIVHLLAAMTLFGIIRRTLLLKHFPEGLSRHAHWFALAVAMIWVVHPLQTQSVTYIVQRAESMMGLFYLLTLYCFVRSVSSGEPSLLWSILTVVACACGMGSKAIMVTAPLMVFLYDRTFVSRTLGELFRKRWLLYGGLAATLSILFMVKIAQSVLSTDGKGVATVGLRLTHKDHPSHISSADYLMTESQVILHYLKLSFWPARQALDYSWPIAEKLDEVWLSGGAILVLLAGALVAFIKRPWVGFAGAWFFLILAPTSSIIPVKDPIYEHRMYLPLAGVIVLVMGGLWWLLRRGMARSDAGGAKAALACFVIGLPIATALGYATHVRNEAYHSEITMWRDTIAKYPRNGRAHNNLGKHLLDSAGGDMAVVSEAVDEFRRATRINPSLFNAFYNMGNGLSQLKRYDEAIAAYDQALLKRHGKYIEAHIMRGNAFTDAGRLPEAEAAFRAALGCLSPHEAKGQRYLVARAHFNLGNTLFKLGREAEAVPEYHAAMKENNQHFRAAYGIGLSQERLNNTEAAIEGYKRSLGIDPSFDKACASLAAVYERTGRVAEALSLCESTLEKNPGSTLLIQRLASLYKKMDRPEDAIALYEAKMQTYGPSVALLRGLASMLEQLGRFTEAYEICRNGLDVFPDDGVLKQMEARLRRYWEGKRQ